MSNERTSESELPATQAYFIETLKNCSKQPIFQRVMMGKLFTMNGTSSLRLLNCNDMFSKQDLLPGICPIWVVMSWNEKLSPPNRHSCCCCYCHSCITYGLGVFVCVYVYVVNTVHVNSIRFSWAKRNLSRVLSQCSLSNRFAYCVEQHLIWYNPIRYRKYSLLSMP